MKKRMMSFLLCFLIGASSLLALTGCKPAVNYDFTVWVPFVSNVVGEYDKHPVFNKLEEMTGIKVKYVHGGYDKIETLFSSNTHYDVMIFNDTIPGFGGTYPGGLEKGISDGRIRDISTLMAQHAPDYASYVNADPDIKREVVMNDGRLTRFFELADAETESWYGYMMREDWLKKVNYVNADGSVKVPVTYDDWEDVLTRFKKAKLSSTPFFLYSAGVDPFNSTSAGYGVCYDFQKDENNVVQYGPYMDAFQGYLDRMRSWYNQGFIDKDFMLSKEYVPISKAVGSMGKDATFGAFTQMYIYMNQYEEMAEKYKNPDYSLIAVPNPKVNASDTLHIRQKSVRAGNYAVLTDKLPESKVQDVMKWLNYFYTEEGKLLMSYGIEGSSYNMVDGKPQYTDLVKDSPKLSPSDAVKKYSVQGFPMLYDASREKQIAQPKEIAAMATWTKDNDAAYILPNVILSPTESNEFTRIMTSLDAYVKDYIYNYIVSKNSLSYSQYQAKLKEEGIEKVIAIKQAAYNRYLAKM